MESEQLRQWIDDVKGKLDSEEHEFIEAHFDQVDALDKAQELKGESRIVQVDGFDCSFYKVSKDGPFHDVRTELGLAYEALFSWSETLEKETEFDVNRLMDLAKDSTKVNNAAIMEVNKRMKATSQVKPILIKELKEIKKKQNK